MASKPQDFDIGRVISNIFGILSRNPVVFFGGALLVLAIPLAIVELVFGLGESGNITTAFAATAIIGGLATLVVTMVLSVLLQGTLIVAALNDLGGKPVDLGACIQRALPKILPLIGLGILVGLGTALGFMLLVVPGLILMVIWSVATPVLMAENPGVIDSMSRSAELTKGSRWHIFGLLVVYFILALIVGGIIGLFTFAGSTIVATVLNIISSTITAAISSAGVAAIYIELRNLQGADTEALSGIFS